MDKITTPYLGIVEENKDPEHLGRLKIRVDSIYGTIGVDDLPWAIPFGLPAGGSRDSGGIMFLPEPGDQVMVLFLDGEPEKPCWTWSMQSVNQAKKFEFRHYGKDGKPDHARVTRYGHSFELTADSVIVTNSQGYSLILQNRPDTATGYIQLRTPRGQLLLVDDQLDLVQAMVNQDLNIQVGQDASVTAGSVSVEARSGPVRLSSTDGVAVSAKDLATFVNEDQIHVVGNSLTFLVGGGEATIAIQGGRITIADKAGSVVALDGSGNAAVSTKDASISLGADGISMTGPNGASVIADATGKITLNSPDVVINSGSVTLGGAVSPVALANLLVTAFNTHTHTNGNNGSPTGPPIVPLVAEAIGSKTTSA